MSSKKKCLFCGGTGLTREHVIPKWVRKELRIQGWVYEQRGTGNARKWNALAVVLPRVCHQCNNELLASLETRVQPILAPLLGGGSNSTPIFIDPSEQATLATWAVKTSLLLTIRSYEREPAGWVPADNLRWLYDHRELDQPPPGAHVWMFGVNAANSLTASSQAACLRDDKGPAAHVGTFTVGYVGFQVFLREVGRPEFSADHEAWLAPRQTFRDGMLTIWPASGTVRWPPPVVFERDALELIASRLGTGLPRVKLGTLRIHMARLSKRLAADGWELVSAVPVIYTEVKTACFCRSALKLTGCSSKTILAWDTRIVFAQLTISHARNSIIVLIA